MKLKEFIFAYNLVGETFNLKIKVDEDNVNSVVLYRTDFCDYRLEEYLDREVYSVIGFDDGLTIVIFPEEEEKEVIIKKYLY